MGPILLSFVLGVFGSLVAAALVPGLQFAAVALMARWLGWLPFGRPPVFAGVWKIAWHVESPRYAPIEVDHAVLVRQFGKHLYAKFRAGRLDCYIHGQVDSGRYVTGKWYDATEGGYHGAFQMIVDPGSREMVGLWIGFSTTGTVKSGKFEWTRASSTSTDDAV